MFALSLVRKGPSMFALVLLQSAQASPLDGEGQVAHARRSSSPQPGYQKMCEGDCSGSDKP